MRKNCFFILMLYVIVCQSQTVIINEVMQSNVDYLMVDNDFPDSWVELYNVTEQDISIKNYSIGLSSDINSAYRVPLDTVIQSKGHILFFCDKENKLLHTDFRIDAGKGDLYLFDGKGIIIDEVHLKKMPAPNIAYGRINDGCSDWIYELAPTAGEANNSNGASFLLPDPVFSMVGGVYNHPISVTVAIPQEDLPDDTKLFVTLDGKEPDKYSMSGTSFVFNLTESTVIRAKLISDHALSKRSVTHSYIYHHSETSLPIISIVSDDDYFYSEDKGILVGGDNIKTTNCYQGWRRPINAEFFDLRNGQETSFNQLCETMVAGNYSRAYPQKSLKLYAHKRFGTKKFNGVFWEDKPNVTKVKSFMLRNYGTGCLYGRFHDALIQKVFGKNIDVLDWQAYQPVILYINGEYKGEYEMRERSDEDYVESNYEGLENIELHNEAQKQSVYFSEETRKNTLFEAFYNCYTKEGVRYDELDAMMDMDNFLNTFIVEVFSTNADYPENNISVWRPIEESGKWRWILKDLDYTALKKSVNYNMFNYMFQTGGDADSEEIQDLNYIKLKCQELYKVMMSLPEFRKLFVDKFSTYLGDFLKPIETLPIIEELDNEIHAEIGPTFEAYSDFNKWLGKYEGFYVFDSLLDPVEHYDSCVMVIKNFWEQRPRIVYQQLSDFFNLGRVFDVTVKTDGYNILFNGNSLRMGNFEGCYFTNRILRLDSGNQGIGWTVIVYLGNGEARSRVFNNSIAEIDFRKFLNDSSNDYIVRSVVEPSLITSTDLIQSCWHEDEGGEDWGINGMKIRNRAKGVFIHRNSLKSTKVIIK